MHPAGHVRVPCSGSQNKENMQNVMIDLETLGTTADAVIVSIGAVRFDKTKIDDRGFYTPISLSSNLAHGRRISEDTLSWWMQQSDAARAVFSAPTETLESALENLSDWFGNTDPFVWSCGASFDIPMLEHAYTQTHLTVPWKFYNSRCFRTMKAMPLAKKVIAPKPAIAHNALADAVAQAQHLQAIWKANEKAALC